MRHIDNFKLFEKKVTIDFPDYLIYEFERLVNEYFDDKPLKNKNNIIIALIQKFVDYVLDAQFYPKGQGSQPLNMEEILQDDDVFDILSLKNFRDVILKDNEQLVPIFLDYISKTSSSCKIS